MNGNKNVVEFLNETVWASLAPSKVHGIGVHAIRDISKGQMIYAKGSPMTKPLRLSSYEGLIPEVERLIRQRWPLAFRGDYFQSPNDDARLISFMNHSENPNYDKYTDQTLKDVSKGEELFEDYGFEPQNKA